MGRFQDLQRDLAQRRCRWLVTGAAGFIGSHLVEKLLRLGQDVVGLDNLSTGFRANLDHVRGCVGDDAWSRFTFIEGDIRRLDDCARACNGVAYVLHQAALGSVPRSIADPIATNATNIDGFVNMLVAARDARVARFVYASSSSAYGDHPALPKVEERVGQPLSPYAVTKCVNELYASVFARAYGIGTIGLRYFNVFGPRQDPHGAYAAVIPRWIAAMIEGRVVEIFGDGETSRDFCHVDNAVQVNLLAATVQDPAAIDQVYNVAVGDRTTLAELFRMQRELLVARFPRVAGIEPVFRDFRAGDVRHSQADIGKAQRLLGYAPARRVQEGLREAMDWYVGNLTARVPAGLVAERK